MTHHFGVLITVPVDVGPLGDAVLTQCAMRQHHGHGTLPWVASHHRYTRDNTGTLQFHTTARGWRPLYGGLLVQVVLGEETTRVAALIGNPDQARDVWRRACAEKQGGLILQKVEGQWYALMRFRKHGGRRRTKGEKRGKV